MSHHLIEKHVLLVTLSLYPLLARRRPRKQSSEMDQRNRSGGARYGLRALYQGRVRARKVSRERNKSALLNAVTRGL